MVPMRAVIIGAVVIVAALAIVLTRNDQPTTSTPAPVAAETTIPPMLGNSLALTLFFTIASCENKSLKLSWVCRFFQSTYPI